MPPYAIAEELIKTSIVGALTLGACFACEAVARRRALPVRSSRATLPPGVLGALLCVQLAWAAQVLAYIPIYESTQTVSFPNGTLDLPEGCEGPLKIGDGADGYRGQIECPREGLVVFISGAAHRDHCGGPATLDPFTERTNVSLRLPDDGFSMVCSTEYRAKDGDSTSQMLVETRPFTLSAEIRNAHQAVLLLRIAKWLESTPAN